MRNLFVVIGLKGAGKTSCCRELYRQVVAASMPAFALVEENERDRAGYPIKIRLVDLGTGEGMNLAERVEKAKTNDDPQGPFCFRPEAFAWAEARVSKALAEGCYPIILDEIGPLELQEKGGFSQALALIFERHQQALVLTSRPELAGLVEASAPTGWKLETIPISEGKAELEARRLAEKLIFHCQLGRGVI